MFFLKLSQHFTLILLLITHLYAQESATNLSVPLTKSPNKSIDIQKVMDYPIPNVLKRYCKDYNVPMETAKIYERELKRYFILAADDDNSDLAMMSTHVDNLWHTFLLFTKDYQLFCNEVFGKFIHHVPLTHEDKEEDTTKIEEMRCGLILG